jgi:hypothetical protein
MTSHGYTPCRCDERACAAELKVCGCGRLFRPQDVVTDECESCYELRMEVRSGQNGW